MDKDIGRALSLRSVRRTDKADPVQGAIDREDGAVLSGRASHDLPFTSFLSRNFVRLLLAAGILWILFIIVNLWIQIWSCQLSTTYFAGQCRKEGTLYNLLGTMGLVSKDSRPLHRCPIPLADDPSKIAIPKRGSSGTIPRQLTYLFEDKPLLSTLESRPLFGGHQTWAQRNESFMLNETMKVHCGFMKNGGAEMDPADTKYVKKCRFVVASGIFDGYDLPHQPSDISARSRKLFCFLMVIDETTLTNIKASGNLTEDNSGGKWVGIWRLVTLHKPPYDEPRRNGKVPKILTHRLFPETQYSIWIDGKMELVVDPLLILERYLWRGGYTFAIARHKHHKSIFEEADSNKRRKRYARPLIDLHMKIYVFEGMTPWSPEKGTVSDVPEGAVIVREHTPLNNLFCCLWFNEVNLFTPRDQLSFGYVVYRFRDSFKFFMFPNCEYNSLFILHKHTREHSSKIEWVKDLNELKGNKSSLRETRGGLGLWTPYPGNLNSVKLPIVSRVSEQS